MKLGKRNLLLLQLYILLSTIMIFMIIFINSVNALAYFAFFHLILTILLLFYFNQRLISLSSIFISLSFLFHFGQFMIIALHLEDIYYSRSIIFQTSQHLIMKTGIFVFITHTVLTLGMIVASFQSNQNSMYKGTTLSDKRLFNIVFAFFLLTFLPLIYTDIIKIIALQNSGYYNTLLILNVGLNKYISLIARFGRVAITFLLIALKNKPKTARIFFIFTLAYFLLMMISGNRGINMIFIINNTYIYFRYISKLNYRNTILITIVGFLILYLLNIISIFRDLSFSYDTFLFTAETRASEGIIYTTLREFGNTIKSVVYSIQFYPFYENYIFGKTYLLGFLTIIPKHPQLLVDMTLIDFTFTNGFPLEFRESIGGSYIGELYSNFGYLGAIFAGFIGYSIGSLNKKVDQCIDNSEKVNLMICAALIPYLFIWIRGYFVELIFVPFWSYVFLEIMTKIRKNLGK